MEELRYIHSAAFRMDYFIIRENSPSILFDCFLFMRDLMNPDDDDPQAGNASRSRYGMASHHQ